MFASLQVVLNIGSLQDSHEDRISCLGLSADGSALCTGSWDTNLKVSILPSLNNSLGYVIHGWVTGFEISLYLVDICLISH